MPHFLQRILLTLCITVALPALAQTDPPARVGRLAHIENQVDFRVDRNESPGPATLNWPISSGAVLESGQRGRAEVWIGSTAYRLAEDSQMEFSVVDDTRVDVRLNSGSLAVSILDRDQVDDVVVVTPDGNVRFQTPGRYRIDVTNDHSELSVQAGRATFDDGQRVLPVAAGQKASRWSDGNDRLDADRTHDAFDRWVANRENATLAGPARRHVSPNMTGYQDLDAYGDWQSAPDYGSVWYPRAVADDWAPYRYGRWAWVAPWGWTWIDQAPWGFAPFHYGRWAIIGGRWGWVPGRIVSRPVYAPALVAWIGNPGWNVGFSSGAAPAVGWFPLAPREVYVPGHRHTTKYVHQINVTHIRDVNVVDRAVRSGPQAPYAHHALPRAVTVVPANMVREGQAITAREVRRQERPELGRAPLARHAPNADWLAPTQGAVRTHGEERRDNNRPRRDFDTPRQNGQMRSVPQADPILPNRPLPASSLPTPEAVNGRQADPRRDGWRGSPETRPGNENRGRPVDVVPTPVPAPSPLRPALVPSEIRQPSPEAVQVQPSDGRRGAFRRPGEGLPVEVGKVPADTLPMTGRENFRRGEGQMRALPPDSAPAPMRRDMPAPEMRIEERQPRPMPPQEMQRTERQPAPPREREAPPVIRQPEMPKPSPEVRMPASPPVREMPPVRVEPPRQPVQELRAPAPQPQPRAEPPRPPVQEFRAPPPPPAPAAPPQQRVEPPRQQAPQGGGQPEQRRRQGKDEERGGGGR
jgi:hypothetical protein